MFTLCFAFYFAVATTEMPLPDKLASEFAVFSTNVAFIEGEELYEITIKSLRLIPAAATFLSESEQIEPTFGRTIGIPVVPEEFQQGKTPYLLGTLQYFLASQLIRSRLFDEALTQLEFCEPNNSIDPAAVLFAKSVCHLQLAQREQGLLSLEQLDDFWEKQPSSQRRYTELAKLMKFEFESLEKVDDIPHIAKRMTDIQRRLGNGNTDEKVQNVEKSVLDSLDKLIEELDKKCQSSSSSGAASQKPGDTERVRRLKAPGNIEDKNIGSKDSWGNLPPKERDAALLRITKEFPSHYRDVIEEFFRQMAGQQAP